MATEGFSYGDNADRIFAEEAEKRMLEIKAEIAELKAGLTNNSTSDVEAVKQKMAELEQQYDEIVEIADNKGYDLVDSLHESLKDEFSQMNEEVGHEKAEPEPLTDESAVLPESDSLDEVDSPEKIEVIDNQTVEVVQENGPKKTNLEIDDDVSSEENLDASTEKEDGEPESSDVIEQSPEEKITTLNSEKQKLSEDYKNGVIDYSKFKGETIALDKQLEVLEGDISTKVEQEPSEVGESLDQKIDVLKAKIKAVNSLVQSGSTMKAEVADKKVDELEKQIRKHEKDKFLSGDNLLSEEESVDLQKEKTAIENQKQAGYLNEDEHKTKMGNLHSKYATLNKLGSESEASPAEVVDVDKDVSGKIQKLQAEKEDIETRYNRGEIKEDDEYNRLMDGVEEKMALLGSQSKESEVNDGKEGVDNAEDKVEYGRLKSEFKDAKSAYFDTLKKDFRGRNVISRLTGWGRGKMNKEVQESYDAFMVANSALHAHTVENGSYAKLSAYLEKRSNRGEGYKDVSMPEGQIAAERHVLQPAEQRLEIQTAHTNESVRKSFNGIKSYLKARPKRAALVGTAAYVSGVAFNLPAMFAGGTAGLVGKGLSKLASADQMLIEDRVLNSVGGEGVNLEELENEYFKKAQIAQRIKTGTRVAAVGTALGVGMGTDLTTAGFMESISGGGAEEMASTAVSSVDSGVTEDLSPKESEMFPREVSDIPEQSPETAVSQLDMSPVEVSEPVIPAGESLAQNLHKVGSGDNMSTFVLNDLKELAANGNNELLEGLTDKQLANYIYEAFPEMRTVSDVGDHAFSAAEWENMMKVSSGDPQLIDLNETVNTQPLIDKLLEHVAEANEKTDLFQEGLDSMAPEATDNFTAKEAVEDFIAEAENGPSSEVFDDSLLSENDVMNRVSEVAEQQAGSAGIEDTTSSESPNERTYSVEASDGSTTTFTAQETPTGWVETSSVIVDPAEVLQGFEKAEFIHELKFNTGFDKIQSISPENGVMDTISNQFSNQVGQADGQLSEAHSNTLTAYLDKIFPELTGNADATPRLSAEQWQKLGVDSGDPLNLGKDDSLNMETLRRLIENWDITAGNPVMEQELVDTVFDDKAYYTLIEGVESEKGSFGWYEPETDPREISPEEKLSGEIIESIKDRNLFGSETSLEATVEDLPGSSQPVESSGANFTDEEIKEIVKDYRADEDLLNSRFEEAQSGGVADNLSESTQPAVLDDVPLTNAELDAEIKAYNSGNFNRDTYYPEVDLTGGEIDDIVQELYPKEQINKLVTPTVEDNGLFSTTKVGGSMETTISSDGTKHITYNKN